MMFRQIKQSSIKQNKNYLNPRTIKGTMFTIFDYYLNC